MNFDETLIIEKLDELRNMSEFEFDREIKRMLKESVPYYEDVIRAVDRNIRCNNGIFV